RAHVQDAGTTIGTSTAWAAGARGSWVLCAIRPSHRAGAGRPASDCEIGSPLEQGGHPIPRLTNFVALIQKLFPERPAKRSSSYLVQGPARSRRPTRDEVTGGTGVPGRQAGSKTLRRRGPRSARNSATRRRS